MDNHPRTPESPFSGPLNTLWTWADNFQRNTSAGFTSLKAKDYIRLIAIIGAYLLLRPYILKLGAKAQERQHAKESAEGGDASLDPNDLRGGGKVEIPGVDDEDEGSDMEGEGTAGDWGRGARLRQRRFIRQALRAHEERLAAEDEETASDKEIEEFLMEEYAMAE